MLLRSLLGCGAVVGCALAIVPAPAALAAATSSAGPSPVVITTTPSARVGGLPASSLDGKVEYIPRRSTFQAGQKASALASAASSVSARYATERATGYDVSWPQCGGAMPPSSQVAIVGVDDGHPFSQNPCLQQEAQWASTAKQRAQYMVVDSPVGWSSPHVLEYAYHGPAGDCTATDYACQSYNWGYNAAYADVQYASSQGATSRQWWLDVELPSSTSIDPSGADCYQANFWVCDPKLNSLVVLAAVTALREQGNQVGVYSTKTQWQAITGGMPLGTPIWIAGFDYAPATYCDPANASTYWFAFGVPRLVQGLPVTFDPDTDC
jgi:hypothetical protein